MKINRMRIGSPVKYSASFYNKLSAEQKRYMEKVGTDKEKEKKCLIEEVDCQKAIGTLRYSEPKFKHQDIPAGKRKKTVDKLQMKEPEEKPDENPGTERISPKRIINTEEKCVIEEVDCKRSLISIGYEEEAEVETIYESADNDLAETDEQLADISETNAEDFAVVPLPADNGKERNIAEYFPEYDINDYRSPNIIASVEDFNIDQDSTSKVMDENPDRAEETLDLQIIKAAGKADEDLSRRKQNKIENINQVFQKIKGYFLEKEFFLKIGDAKKVLHTEAIYMENKVGFLSLFSVLGLFGIFTDNRACLGFFGFLYFIRYFFTMPDESFKTSLLKAAAAAFFINLGISVLTVVLWLLIKDAVLFPLGLSFGVIVPVVVFMVILTVYGEGKK